MMGVGLRLSGIAADELVAADTLEEFRAFLARERLYVFTINAFPYGPFHGARIKEDVYQPDWVSPVRLAFTDTCSDILAALLPDGVLGSISTVPGTFKPLAQKPGVPDAIAELLLRHVAHLVEIERGTGKHIALAIEPEPYCFLETADEVIVFFERALFARASICRFSALIGLNEAQAEQAIRRHLGICYDVCHGAVEFEAPVAAMRRIASAGILIPKIQLSAAMRIAAIDRELVQELARFDEGTYLHQVVVRNGGGLERFLDLGEAFQAFDAGRARGEWRVHCHVPIFLPDGPGLGSTQPDLKETLAALKRTAIAPHLEVETYTWDVLPKDLQFGSKIHAIVRELGFVREELAQ
jgi:hypothetical protein